jgi:hypothetical protein
MRAALFPLAVAATLLSGAAPTLAQQSWGDLGKDLLKQTLGQQTPRPAESTAAPAATTAAPAATTTPAATNLAPSEIGAGLKDALKLATGRVTDRLGRPDGFNGNALVHIPLPGKLETLRSGLSLVGKSGMLDDLELRMNRAAEAATPQAKQIFLSSLDKMSVADAGAILTGPKDSATQYFKRTMTPDLTTAMRPLIDSELSQTGAVQSLSSLTSAASTLPLVGQVLSNGPGTLTDHVLERALSAIFTGIGEEEAAIRSDPAKRSTDLLKRLFGGS